MAHKIKTAHEIKLAIYKKELSCLTPNQLDTLQACQSSGPFNRVQDYTLFRFIEFTKAQWCQLNVYHDWHISPPGEKFSESTTVRTYNGEDHIGSTGQTPFLFTTKKRYIKKMLEFPPQPPSDKQDEIYIQLIIMVIVPGKDVLYMSKRTPKCPPGIKTIAYTGAGVTSRVSDITIRGQDGKMQPLFNKTPPTFAQKRPASTPSESLPLLPPDLPKRQRTEPLPIPVPATTVSAGLVIQCLTSIYTQNENEWYNLMIDQQSKKIISTRTTHGNPLLPLNSYPLRIQFDPFTHGVPIDGCPIQLFPLLSGKYEGMTETFLPLCEQTPLADIVSAPIRHHMVNKTGICGSSREDMITIILTGEESELKIPDTWYHIDFDHTCKEQPEFCNECRAQSLKWSETLLADLKEKDPNQIIFRLMFHSSMTTYGQYFCREVLSVVYGTRHPQTTKNVKYAFQYCSALYSSIYQQGASHGLLCPKTTNTQRQDCLCDEFPHSRLEPLSTPQDLNINPDLVTWTYDPTDIRPRYAPNPNPISPTSSNAYLSYLEQQAGIISPWIAALLPRQTRSSLFVKEHPPSPHELPPLPPLPIINIVPEFVMNTPPRPFNADDLFIDALPHHRPNLLRTPISRIGSDVRRSFQHILNSPQTSRHLLFLPSAPPTPIPTHRFREEEKTFTIPQFRDEETAPAPEPEPEPDNYRLLLLTREMKYLKIMRFQSNPIPIDRIEMVLLFFLSQNWKELYEIMCARVDDLLYDYHQHTVIRTKLELVIDQMEKKVIEIQNKYFFLICMLVRQSILSLFVTSSI